MGKPFTKLQQEAAFDRYYAMGASRVLNELRKNLVDTEEFTDRSPALQTLKTWSKENNWQERLKLRDIENSKKVQAKTDREVVNTKADYRKDIRLTQQPLKAAINKVIVPAKDGKPATINIEVENARDLALIVGALEKLIKLDLVMIGEADSHTQLSGDGISFNFGDKITEDDI